MTFRPEFFGVVTGSIFFLVLSPTLDAGLEIEVGLDQGSLATGLKRLTEIRAGGDAGPVVIRFASGVHELEGPLEFGVELIGEGLTLKGPATLSGGSLVSGFEVGKDGVWRMAVDSGRPAQVFGKDGALTEARFPDEGELRVEKVGEDKRTSFTFSEGDLPKLADPASARLVFFHDWSISRVPVKAVDAESRTVTLAAQVGPTAAHYAMDHYEKQPRYFLEGVREFLTKPGEWCVDAGEGILSYLPFPGEKPAEFELTIPRIPRILAVTGGKNLRLEGLGFSHCNWVPEGDRYAAGQATFHESGGREMREAVPPMVLIDGVEGPVVKNCVFENSSGGGVWLRGGVAGAEVSGSVFRQLGGNGLMIGETGDSKAPTSGVSVKDCLVEKCGTRFYGAVGIWVGKSVEVSVVGNEVRELPYTGISLGWQWNPRISVSRGHLIADNRIHHVMRTLSDGGGIYTLGAQPGTVLRSNDIHDIGANSGKAESNGIFMDEGSSQMLVEKNHIHGVSRSPMRFHRAGEITLRGNRLEPAEGVTPLRFNNTPESNVTVE